MEKGTMKFFNDEKGFGFIAPDNDEKDIFVHATGVDNGPIKENNLVIYETTQSQKGLCAINVKL